MVIEAAKPAHNWVKDWLRVNGQDSRLSPEMSKKGKKPMKSPQVPPPDIDLPQSAVKQNSGITEAVFQFLEVRTFHLPSRSAVSAYANLISPDHRSCWTDECKLHRS